MSTHRYRAGVLALAVLVAALPVLACAATPQDSSLASTESAWAAWNQCATLGAAPFGGRSSAFNGLVGVLAWHTAIADSRDSLPSRALGTAPRQMRASGSLLAYLRRLVI